MKPFNIYIVLLLGIFTINTSNTSFAQDSLKKETIKVWGNCDKCKKHIEKAARSADVVTANWNEDSKELKVTYDPTKASSITIQQAIAKAGYDTQNIKGDDKAYNNLDHCCQYERKKTAKEKE
jgi:mercuric ion binding protein